MPWTLNNRTVLVPSIDRRLGTGWLPPTIDPRDFTDANEKIKPVTDVLAQRLKTRKSKALTAPPTSVDLRQWCSPVENQGKLGSCTAHAAIGVVEYFERRSAGKHIDGSRRFVEGSIRRFISLLLESIIYGGRLDRVHFQDPLPRLLSSAVRLRTALRLT